MPDSTAQIQLTEQLPTFRRPAAKWWQAIGFCLLLSLAGLRLYPIWLVLIIFLFWRWRNDRYDFLVELTLLMGGFAFIPSEALPLKVSDIALICGVVGFVIYRKNRLVMRLTVATLAYFGAVILIALTSLESLSIQFYRMRNYFLIISFFIPLIVFANRRFDWNKFMDSIVVHALVICGFYIVDTYLIGGYVLLPGAGASGMESSIFSLDISGFFSLPRHYPPGLYWLIPCVVALNFKKLRFSPLQWTVIVLALYASRTNSLLFALLGCWIFCRPKLKQVMIYSVVGVFAIIVGYFADDATGRYLRLADNVDQFVSLEAVEDDEDLAAFGTGRMAQILPKWELLSDMKRLHLGFGFIHPTKTTNPVFQIHNQYYIDSSKADEVATEVEVTQVQTILDIGFIGFFVQLAYYIGIYYLIRKLNHSVYYVGALLGVSLLGVGGFAGLSQPHGLILLGVILGTVIAANKPLVNEVLPLNSNCHDS